MVLGTVWLSVAGCFTGCQTESTNDSARGRKSGAVDRGAANIDAGEQHETDGSTSLTVLNAVAAPDAVTVTLSRQIYGYFVSYCGDAPYLLKRDPAHDGWLGLEDDTPRMCSGEPYFIDGTYVENACEGCDGGDPCHGIDTFQVSTSEYVKTGEKPNPNGVLSDGGNGSGAIPSIETRQSTGPYHLVLNYWTSSSCQGARESAELVVPE